MKLSDFHSHNGCGGGQAQASFSSWSKSPRIWNFCCCNVWTSASAAICQIGFGEIGNGSVFDHRGNTIPLLPPYKGLKLTIWLNCKTITPHSRHHVLQTNKIVCKILEIVLMTLLWWEGKLFMYTLLNLSFQVGREDKPACLITHLSKSNKTQIAMQRPCETKLISFPWQHSSNGV